MLERVRADHPDDWRVRWYEAVGQLARGDIAPAAERFRGVRRLLPGELAPMLALGVAAEHGGDPSTALRWYDAVSRTDEWFISASFGAARCAQAVGRDDLAAREYERVPSTSSRYAEAQSSRALLLMGRAVKDGQVGALYEVAASLDALELSPSARAELVLSCLLRGRDLLATGSLDPNELEPLLGWPFTDEGLRTGLESVYRELAALSPNRAERISLVDKANAVRPRTWT